MLQVAGHPIGAVGAAVGAARRDPEPAGHAPLLLAGPDPGPLGRGLQTGLRLIGPPVPEVEMHGHARFGGAAFAQNGAVDQIGQPFGPHAAAVGQAQAEENAVENVALAGAVGAGHHGETLFERDRHRAAERLEMGELDLIDVNQQARLPSDRNLAEAQPLPRGRKRPWGGSDARC